MSLASPVPRFAAQSRWSDFFQGLGLPFRAVGLVFASRKLFGLAAIASLVTFASLVGLVWVLAHSTGELVGWMWMKPASWYGLVAWYLLATITFAVLLIVGANTVPLLVLSPLQDPISEATEALCGERAPARFSVSGVIGKAVASVGHTLARVGLLLFGHALLLLLNFVPSIGNVAWTALSTLWTMGWLAVEYLDAPMTRHRYPFSAVRRLVWDRLALCLGFGAAVWIILWVPVLDFFLIPIAVIAGTLLFRGLRDARALGPPPGRD